MPDGLVRPHRVPRLREGVNHAGAVSSVTERLLVTRVDGYRTAAEVCAGGPFDAVESLAALARLEGEGVIELEAETDGPAFSYFTIDVDDPPAGIGSVLPFPVEKIDDAEQPTKSDDYFLYMQVDGRTSIEGLAAVWSQPLARTLQGLIELFHRGLVDFPKEFKKQYLVTIGGEKEMTKDLAPESEALLVGLSIQEGFRTQIWELVPAINSEADMMRLDVERTEGYPLALVDGRHTVGEICDLSIRTTAETVTFVLYLFHVGLVTLNPPAEVESPVVATPEPDLPVLEPVEPSNPGLQALPVLEPVDDASDGPITTPGGFMEMEWDDDEEEPPASAPIVTPAQPEDRGILLTPPPPSAADSEESSYESLPSVRAVTGPDFANVTGVHVLPTSYNAPPEVQRTVASLEMLSGTAVDALLAHGEIGTTGTIDVLSGGATRTLWLEAGELVAVTSDQPVEDLGLHLFQSGAIPPEAYGGMEAARRMSGQTVEAVILEQGILAEGDLQARARAQDVELVRSAVAPPDAEIEPSPGDLPADLFRRAQSLVAVLGHGPLAASGGASGEAFTDPYKAVLPAALKVLLVDHQEQHCQVRRPAPSGLSDREAALFSYVADATDELRLADVLSNSQLGKTKTRRFLYALYCEGYIVFDPSPGILLEHNCDEEDLSDELERQEESELFTRLGLHLTANGLDVEEAYARMAPHYDTATVVGESPAVAELVKEIRARIDESFEGLSEDAARRAYRKELCGDLRLEFHAEVEFRRGERLLLGVADEADLSGEARKDLAAAASSSAFARAHDLRPGEPKYLAYLALAQGTEANFDSHPARLQRARLALGKAVDAAGDDPTVQAVAARFHQDFGSADTASGFAGKARSLAQASPESQPRLKALGI